MNHVPADLNQIDLQQKPATLSSCGALVSDYGLTGPQNQQRKGCFELDGAQLAPGAVRVVNHGLDFLFTAARDGTDGTRSSLAQGANPKHSRKIFSELP